MSQAMDVQIMTSRLKRKLDDIQDGHSGNIGESFVKYGTALPALSDTKKDKGEFVPIWKQEVRDEQGRRRLHGAWTGGFSAGYFNTVGSKEGWTPSTFKSSRSSKASSSQQRAEDFMDEEDMADMRSGQKLQTNADFDALNGTAGESSNQQSQTGPTAALRDLVEPSKDRIGERLLRRMGWREGQGVGPRVSARARRRQAQELGIVSEDVAAPDDDDEAAKHTFAPLDRTLVVYNAKENMYGLGYSQGQTLQQALHADKPMQGPARPEASSRAAGAWGLGAMEDADEDDLSHFDNGTAADNMSMVLDEDDSEVIMQRSSPSKKSLIHSRDAAQSVTTFNDGTIVISHFVAAGRPQAPDEWFEPPAVPKDWQPDPGRVFAQTLRAPPQQSSRQNLSADQRGELLGEEKLKAPIDSVLDYITAKSKERLDAFTRAGGRPATDANAVPLPEDAAPLNVPLVDPTLAAAALRGFLPFTDNLDKQARYKRFLEHHAGVRPDESFQPWASGERLEELNRELEEFTASARIFTPMSNAMAARFTSSSITTILNDTAPRAGLRTPAPLPAEEAKTEQAEALPAKATTAAGQAAREDRFGRLTRTITRFYPTRLACKRFNVPDPYPDGPHHDDDGYDAGSFPSKESMADIVPNNMPPPSSAAITDGKDKAPYREGPPKPLGSVGLGEDETQGRDTLTYERPSDALFKAIFADSDDDEEDNEDKETAKGAAPSVQPPNKSAEPLPAWKERVAAESLSTEPIIKEEEDPNVPFRPTFKPKADRQTTTTSTGPKRDKKKRDKVKTAALSFDMEGEVENIGIRPEKQSKSEKPGKHKARKRASTAGQMDEDEIWVEKAAAEPPPVVMMHETSATSIQPRMRASDLY